ncbi:MAG: hypothetical protein EXR72_10885 [Myxococcales bacterium]|nr:hypothetical protein [Myxococcales bacterium]
MSIPRHILFLSIACFAPLVALGCGHKGTQREPDEFAGCSTDESWVTFDDQEVGKHVTIDDALAASFRPPIAAGAMHPATPKPTFSWKLTATLDGKPNGTAACDMKCPLCGSHEAAVTGDLFDLQFSTGGAVTHRVLTTLQNWTPSDAVWASWKGKSLSLATVRMVVKLGEVSEGPYQATKPIAFSVGR